MKIQSLITAIVLAGASAAHAQAPATPGVDQRQANQQQRIDQGVASGQLTQREANRMQRQQNRIGRHEEAAKADGVVTKQERARLHHEQNQASRHIKRQKHDAQAR